MRNIVIATAVLALIAVLVAAAQGPAADATPSLAGMVEPTDTAEGDLICPEGYRTCVFIRASLGLSYNDDAKREEPGAPTNVYIQPDAYGYSIETGERSSTGRSPISGGLPSRFPDGTMLPMDVFRPGSRESINQAGYLFTQFYPVLQHVAVRSASGPTAEHGDSP